MKKFILVYYGMPDFKSAEEAKEHMQQWEDWANGIGDALVERGKPAKEGKNVSRECIVDADGKGRFTGYSIIQAENLDEAVEMTKKNPFVTDGGTMGVHEMSEM